MYFSVSPLNLKLEKMGCNLNSHTDKRIQKIQELTWTGFITITTQLMLKLFNKYLFQLIQQFVLSRNIALHPLTIWRYLRQDHIWLKINTTYQNLHETNSLSLLFQLYTGGFTYNSAGSYNNENKFWL